MNETFESRRFITGIPVGRCVKTSVTGSNIEFILSYPGHHFDYKWNLIDTSLWPAGDPKWSTVRLPSFAENQLNRTLGLYTIGIIRKIDMWDMAWGEWEHPTEEGAEDKKSAAEKGEKKAEEKFSKNLRLRTRKTQTRYFYLTKFQYGFEMEGVETSSGIKVNIKFSIFVAGYNPWTALVDNDDWYGQLEELVQARVRDYIGGSDFFELLSEDPDARENLLKSHPLLVQVKKGKAKAKSLGSFSDYMSRIQIKDGRAHSSTSGTLVPLKEGLGVEILDARMRDVSLTDSDELSKKLSGVVIAEIARQEKVKELKAEAEGIKLKGSARGFAENQISKAKQLRLETVDREYLKTPEGAAVLATEKHADAMVGVAEHIGAEKSKVTNVVMPQNVPITITKSV